MHLTSFNNHQYQSVSFFRWLQVFFPTPPTPTASIEEQEKYRKACIASSMMLLVLSTVIIGLVLSFLFQSSPFTLIILAVVGVEAVTALLLNKAGQLTLAGVLFVGLYTIGIVISYSLLPAGLDVSQVIGYDILLIGVLLSAIFFPAWSVFLVASFNSAFILWNFYTQAHAPLLSRFVEERGGYVAIERTIALQFVIALLTYLLVNSATQALQRAYRAEEVSRLLDELAKRERAEIAQKAQLDESIQLIVTTLTQYANGNWHARVPLTNNNVLWHIAGSINNLLARLVHLRQENRALRDTRLPIVSDVSPFPSPPTPFAPGSIEPKSSVKSSAPFLRF